MYTFNVLYCNCTSVQLMLCTNSGQTGHDNLSNLISFCHIADFLPSCRIDCRKSLATFSIHKLIVDKELLFEMDRKCVKEKENRPSY